MTTPLRSADAEIQNLVAFRSRHRAALERAFRRARADSDVELPFTVFSLRLFEACELVFGERSSSRSLIGRFIDTLHAADLYLATAAGEGDEEAQRLLRRWYAPLLARRAGPGAETLEAALLGGTGPSAPLAHYFGMSPLARWLGAAVASAMPSAPPAIGMREFAFGKPELRRNLDVVASRVLSTRRAEVRFAVALTEVAGADAQAVANALNLGEARLHRSWRKIASEVARDTETLLTATGSSRSERRMDWLRIAESVAAATEKLTSARGKPVRGAIAAAMARASLRRAVRAHTATPCPERNRLLATLEPPLRLELNEELEHASTCWPCLESATAALRAAPPAARRRALVRPRLIALLAVASLLLVLSWRMPWPLAKPNRQPATVADAALVALTPSPSPREDAGIVAQLPDLRQHPGILAPPPMPSASTRSTLATPPRQPASSPTPRPTPNREPRGTPPSATPALVTETSLVTPTPPPSPSPPTPEPTPITAREPPRTPALRSASGASSPARLVNLAVSRYRPGEERRTIDLLQRAIEMAPDSAVAHLDCATLLDRVGERQRAAFHWGRFVSLAPTDADAAFARQRLSQR